MDAAGEVVTVPASNATATTIQKSTDTFNVNQSNNNNSTHIQTNTHSSSNSLPNKTANSILVGSSSCLNIGGSSNSNSSCGSSSVSSNSSGYGSSTTTPTNNYDLQNTTPTTTPIPTTPVANAEHIIPVATVAAVTPFYNEAITTHNLETTQNQHHQHHLHHQQQTQPLQQQTQQQHVLPTHHQHQQYSQNYLPTNVQQQHHPQYLPRQQYFSPYDYQQPAPTHNLPTSNATPAVAPYNMLIPGAYELPSSAYGSSQYKTSNSSVSTPYERSSLVKTNATSAYPQQPHVEQHESRALNQLTGLLPSTKPKSSSSSLIGSSPSTNTSKPQATATPFYANPNPFYDNYKHKIPFDYHDTYSTSPPNTASAYHQQQKYYAAAKSQLKEASYGSPAGFNSKTAYANTSNMFPGPTSGLNLSSAPYDKYMYPHAAPTTGYAATGHLGNETPPEVNNYRKPVVGANINSHSWPWGIEYASGNSRSIPPPTQTTSHIPTATVAPTHASHLNQNPTVLSRDPFYAGHDKYAGKYDKYTTSAYPQTYISPPTTRHMWPNAPHASQLNERHLLSSGPPGLTSHSLHSSTYYPNNTATALNSRQTCCTQPYQPQSCYYPVPTRLPHSQNPTAAPLPSASYLGSQQPLGQSHHLNALTASCKYGGVLPDYGNANKVKASNDLFLNSHLYDNNPPAHNYGYAASHSSNQQLYNPNSHQPLAHGNAPPSLYTNDPLNANPTSYTNDLNLTTSNFDNYHNHLDSHLGPQTLTGLHNTQQPPAYGPTAAKRALLDYRKPIQPQPPPPTIPQDCYTTLTSRDRYNHQELLNTPETTTTFEEYEVQHNQATDLSSEVLTDSAEAAGDSNKNLSLRDFIANWNDDEDEYQNNEEINFDQTAVINEVLQTAPVEQEATTSGAAEVATIQEVKVIKPATVDTKDEEGSVESNEAAAEQNNLVKDKAAAQYVNLPDIVIDIKKSNNVNSSITTPTTSHTSNSAQAIDTAGSVSLTDFDVEKELDELNLKKSPQKEITKEVNDIKDSKHNETAQHTPDKTQNRQLSLEDFNLEPNTKTVLNATTTGLVSNQGAEISEHYLKDIEGYESSSSRHSNESAFEKEYETFINKITSETDVSKAKGGDIDFDKNVQDFSKFYKRKRKLKEDEQKSGKTTNQDKKKAKTMDLCKAHTSNFPQAYTKKSRNRFNKAKRGKSRTHKPLSAFYKIIYAIRHLKLQRQKRVREFMLELKDKHLPLIKRQSIKNFLPELNENIFQPKTLKSLCIMVFNTEEFHQFLGVKPQQAEDEAEEVEQKHICTDPTCETCEVIKSLMEAESFEAPLIEQPEEPSTVYCAEVTKEAITILEDITITNELNLSTEDTIIIANAIEEDQFLQQNLPELELNDNFQMIAEPLQPALESLTDLNLENNLSTLDEALMESDVNKFPTEDGIDFFRHDLIEGKSSNQFESCSKAVGVMENESTGFELPIDENFLQPITDTDFFENSESKNSLENHSPPGKLDKCDPFPASNEDITKAKDLLQANIYNEEKKTTDLNMMKEKSGERESENESESDSSDSSDSETESSSSSSSSDSEDSSKNRSSQTETSDSDNEEKKIVPSSKQPKEEAANQKEKSKEEIEKNTVEQEPVPCSSPKTTIIPENENHPKSPERIVLRITKSLKSNEQSLRVENISRKAAVQTQIDNPAESENTDKEVTTNKKTEILNIDLEKETDQQLAESCKSEKKLVTPLKLILRGKEYLRVKTNRKSLKLPTESENKSESETEKEEPIKQIAKAIKLGEPQPPGEQKDIRKSHKKVKVMLRRCSGKTTPKLKINNRETVEESLEKEREKIEISIREDNMKTKQANELINLHDISKEYINSAKTFRFDKDITEMNSIAKDIIVQESEERVNTNALHGKSKESSNSPKSIGSAEDKKLTGIISIPDNFTAISDLNTTLLRPEESSKSLGMEDTPNDEPNEDKDSIAVQSPSQRSDNTVLFRTEILTETEDTQTDANLLLSPQEYPCNDSYPQHDFIHDIELEKAASFAVVFENRDDHLLGNLNRSSSLEIIETYSLTSSDEEEVETQTLTDSESCKLFNYDAYNDDEESVGLMAIRCNDSKTIVISDDDDDSLHVPRVNEVKRKSLKKTPINNKVILGKTNLKCEQTTWAKETRKSTKSSTGSKTVDKPLKLNGPKNKRMATNLPMSDSFKNLEADNLPGVEFRQIQPTNAFDMLKQIDITDSDHDFSESTFESEEEFDQEIVWRSNAPKMQEKATYHFDTFPTKTPTYGTSKDENIKTSKGKLGKSQQINKPKAGGNLGMSKVSLKKSNSKKVVKQIPTVLARKQNQKETKSAKAFEKELIISPENPKKTRCIQNETKTSKRSIKNKPSSVDDSEGFTSKQSNKQESPKCTSRKSSKTLSDKQNKTSKAKAKKIATEILKSSFSEQPAKNPFEHQLSEEKRHISVSKSKPLQRRQSLPEHGKNKKLISVKPMIDSDIAIFSPRSCSPITKKRAYGPKSTLELNTFERDICAPTQLIPKTKAAYKSYDVQNVVQDEDITDEESEKPYSPYDVKACSESIINNKNPLPANPVAGNKMPYILEEMKRFESESSQQVQIVGELTISRKKKSPNSCLAQENTKKFEASLKNNNNKKILKILGEVSEEINSISKLDIPVCEDRVPNLITDVPNRLENEFEENEAQTMTKAKKTKIEANNKETKNVAANNFVNDEIKISGKAPDLQVSKVEPKAAISQFDNNSGKMQISDKASALEETQDESIRNDLGQDVVSRVLQTINEKYGNELTEISETTKHTSPVYRKISGEALCQANLHSLTESYDGENKISSLKASQDSECTRECEEAKPNSAQRNFDESFKANFRTAEEKADIRRSDESQISKSLSYTSSTEQTKDPDSEMANLKPDYEKFSLLNNESHLNPEVKDPAGDAEMTDNSKDLLETSETTVGVKECRDNFVSKPVELFVERAAREEVVTSDESSSSSDTSSDTEESDDESTDEEEVELENIKSASSFQKIDFETKPIKELGVQPVLKHPSDGKTEIERKENLVEATKHVPTKSEDPTLAADCDVEKDAITSVQLEPSKVKSRQDSYEENREAVKDISLVAETEKQTTSPIKELDLSLEASNHSKQINKKESSEEKVKEKKVIAECEKVTKKEEALPITSSASSQDVVFTLQYSQTTSDEETENKTENYNKEKSAFSELLKDNEEISLEQISTAAEEFDVLTLNSNLLEVNNKEMSREVAHKVKDKSITSDFPTEVDVEENSTPVKNTCPSNATNKEDICKEGNEEHEAVVTDLTQKEVTSLFKETPAANEERELLPAVVKPSIFISSQDKNSDTEGNDVSVATKVMKQSNITSLEASPIPTEKNKLQTEASSSSEVTNMKDIDEEHKDEDILVVTRESPISAEELENIYEESTEADDTESGKGNKTNSLLGIRNSTEELEDDNEESFAESDLLTACSSKVMSEDDSNEESIEEDVTVFIENIRSSGPSSVVTSPTSSKVLDSLNYPSKIYNKEYKSEEFAGKKVDKANESPIPTEDSNSLPGTANSSKIINIDVFSKQSKDEDESLIPESIKESETNSFLKFPALNQDLKEAAFSPEVVNNKDIYQNIKGELLSKATYPMQINEASSVLEIPTPTEEQENVRESMKEVKTSSVIRSPTQTGEPEDIDKECIAERLSDETDTRDSIETSSVMRSPTPAREPEGINEELLTENVSCDSNSSVESPILADELKDIKEESIEDVAETNEGIRDIEISSLVGSPNPTKESKDTSDEPKDENASAVPDSIRETETRSLQTSSILTEEPDINEKSIAEDISNECVGMRKSSSLVENQNSAEELEDMNEVSIEENESEDNESRSEKPEDINEDVAAPTESLMDIETNSLEEISTNNPEDLNEEFMETDELVKSKCMTGIEAKSLVKSPISNEKSVIINEEPIENVSAANKSISETEITTLVGSLIPTQELEDMNDEFIEINVPAATKTMQEIETNLVKSPNRTVSPEDMNENSKEKDESISEAEIYSSLESPVSNEELNLSDKALYSPQAINKEGESLEEDISEKGIKLLETHTKSELKHINSTEGTFLLNEVLESAEICSKENVSDESEEEDESKVETCSLKESSLSNEVQDLLAEITHSAKVKSMEDVPEESNEEDISKTISFDEKPSSLANSDLPFQSTYKSLKAEDFIEEPKAQNSLETFSEELGSLPTVSDLSIVNNSEKDTSAGSEEVTENQDNSSKLSPISSAMPDIITVVTCKEDRKIIPKGENENIPAFEVERKSEELTKTSTEELDLSGQNTNLSKETLEEEKDVFENIESEMEMDENSVKETPTTTEESDLKVEVSNSIKITTEIDKSEQSKEGNNIRLETSIPEKYSGLNYSRVISTTPEKIDLLSEVPNHSKPFSQEELIEESKVTTRVLSVSTSAFKSITEEILEESPISNNESEVKREEEDTLNKAKSLKETDEIIIRSCPSNTEELHSPVVHQLSNDTNEDESKDEGNDTEYDTPSTLLKSKLNQDILLNKIENPSHKSDFTAEVTGPSKEKSKPKVEIASATPVFLANYTKKNTECQKAEKISSKLRDQTCQLDEPAREYCDYSSQLVTEELMHQDHEFETQSLLPISDITKEQQPSTQIEEMKTSDKTENAKNSEENPSEILKQSERLRSSKHQVAEQLSENIAEESSSQVECLKAANSPGETKSSSKMIFEENKTTEISTHVKDTKAANNFEEPKSSEKIPEEGKTEKISPQSEAIQTFHKTEASKSSEEIFEDNKSANNKLKPAKSQEVAESSLAEQSEKVLDIVGVKSTTQSSLTSDELSIDFFGFKNNHSSFEEESEDFHGFEDLEEVARIRQEIENLNDDTAANDGFSNRLSLNRDTHKTSTASLAESSSSEINELEALEKELSQHQLVMPETDEDRETENYEMSNVSSNDIEHIKKMLESDEELQTECENQLDRMAHTSKDKSSVSQDNNISYDHLSSLNSKNSIIPKLSDLCRAALNSSLNSSKNLAQEHTDTSNILVERELSVEEALAEMYRQAGVLLSDPEDCDNDVPSPGNNEGQDVLLINLQEILNSDNNDVYVLQCDMNDNVLNVVQSSTEQEQENQANAGLNAERVNTLQIILDTQNSEPQIHIISSDSESEVIILSDDDSDISYTPFRTREDRVTIPFINDEEINNSVADDDGSFDISTIHHEEIVPDNLAKFLEEEFYKYLHEKYVQRNISKYYHANRILKKYKKRFLRRQ